MKHWIAAVSVAALVALPSAAESWGVNAEPETPEGSKPFCMLWYGSTSPMMNLTVMADRIFFSSRASAFDGMQDGTEGSITFPGGQSLASPQVRKLGPDTLALFLSPSLFEPVLDQLKVDGDITFKANGQSVIFPATNLASGIEILKSCTAKLPPAD
ncbi:MAG: hypothetical protein ACK4P2_04475 [Hyphomonas sp.]